MESEEPKLPVVRSIAWLDVVAALEGSFANGGPSETNDSDYCERAIDYIRHTTDEAVNRIIVRSGRRQMERESVVKNRGNQSDRVTQRDQQECPIPSAQICRYDEAKYRHRRDDGDQRAECEEFHCVGFNGMPMGSI